MTTATSTIESQFNSLINGSTHANSTGVAGTNNSVRDAIWDAFRAKYTGILRISIDGVQLALAAHHSKSGKSTSYLGRITDEAYVAITGSNFGLSQKKPPYIQICNGKVIVSGGGKCYTTIENSKVKF